ncbi:hypothetical protein [Rhizorhabdus dicambivorans]|nr:hypothetical protein [Rhizorhabdus dicambivorans]
MRSTVAGCCTLALAMIALPASAQIAIGTDSRATIGTGTSIGGSAGLSAQVPSTGAGAGAAVATQAATGKLPDDASGNVKRSERKTRPAEKAGVAASGKASVQSHGGSRSPGGGN